MFKVNKEGDPEQSPGFRRMFGSGRMTLGVFFPIEAFAGDMPSMYGQEALAERTEALGFAALWFRDVPLRDPSFGDVGQIYDPWVYLGYIASRTRYIALATGSVVAPLRHPLHIAKAAASVDRLSRGRLVLGIGTGDRPSEFSAFRKPFEDRGANFRESIQVIRRVLENDFPEFESPFGAFSGVDLVPKPIASGIPIVVTGFSQQGLGWIARHSCGWITYPREIGRQAEVVKMWRAAVEEVLPGRRKPFAQSLYVDLTDDPGTLKTPIHLGYRLGRRALTTVLEGLEEAGVDHVALNLKYGRRPATDVVQEIGELILPGFLPEAKTHETYDK